MKTLFQYISIILISITLFACQKESDKQKTELEEHKAQMSEGDRKEFQAVIEEYEKNIGDIDKSTPIQLTVDLRSGFDKLYCVNFFGRLSSFGGTHLAKCSEGRIPVCGTQGGSTEVKAYCVIHDAEADQYYRVLSETPNDHCADGREVKCD